MIIDSILIATLTGVGMFSALVLGFLFGFYWASKNDYVLKINDKEDFELKTQHLQNLIEAMESENALKKDPSYNANELFPPTVFPDYGLPRSLKE